MEPAYRHGDRLMVNRLAYIRATPRPGDVVILHDPDDPARLLLKRVTDSMPGAAVGYVHVLGDNAHESRDSRQFGAVPVRLIVGRAWRKY
jgi:signal peptidase I